MERRQCTVPTSLSGLPSTATCCCRCPARAAESETALALVGWSPDRVAAANWVLAGVLAGAAGVVIGPITTADPVTFTLLVVPALAAVLVAGFSSFGLTTAAALSLGMVQSL